MTTVMIDTHCHLDRYRDPIATLETAGDAGIRVVAVTEDPAATAVCAPGWAAAAAWTSPWASTPSVPGTHPPTTSRGSCASCPKQPGSERSVLTSQKRESVPRTTTRRLRCHLVRPAAANTSGHRAQPRSRARHYCPPHTGRCNSHPALVYRPAYRSRHRPCGRSLVLDQPGDDPIGQGGRPVTAATQRAGRARDGAPTLGTTTARSHRSTPSTR